MVTLKKAGSIFLTVLPVTILFLLCPLRVSADRAWFVGEWQLTQYFSQDHREVVFKGRLRIHRERDHFHGRIYFDVVGKWEPLEDVEITDETVSFTRPQYEQRFHGHREGHHLVGTYRDRLHQGKWEWRAERE